MLKSVRVKMDGTAMTPEEAEARDAARRAEAEKWRHERAEAVRLAVPRTIAALRAESLEKITQADKLAALLGEFPDLRRWEGRWKKVVYYSATVNGRVTDFERRHNCGCCHDSPLEVWPYVETEHGRVYSDPPMFSVGEQYDGGDRANPGWDDNMRAKGIPDPIIERVSHLFTEEDEDTTDDDE
jgi:hypothetical protein